MDNFADLNDKARKKIAKIMKNAAYAIGGGLGFLGLKYVFSDVGGDEKVRALFDGLGYWLIVYGALIVATAVFKSSLLFRVHSFLTWLATPAVMIKLFMDFV